MCRLEIESIFYKKSENLAGGVHRHPDEVFSVKESLHSQYAIKHRKRSKNRKSNLTLFLLHQDSFISVQTQTHTHLQMVFSDILHKAWARFTFNI